MTTPLILSIDLRGVPCMPVDVSRLLNSDTWIIAQDDPAVGYALINLLLNAWHQVPAASVPSDARILARIAGVSADVWGRVQADVMAAWALCDDGRFYHPVLAAKALEADERRAKKAAFSAMQAAKGRASAAARAAQHSVTTKRFVAPKLDLPVANLPVAPEVDPRQIPLLDNAFALVAQLEDAPKPTPKDLKTAEEVFKHWQIVMGSSRSKFGTDREKLINKWLKDYSAEDLKLAIDGCRNDPFSMGENDRKTYYNGLELILRDRAHIEKFIVIATRENDKLKSPKSGLSTKSKATFDAIKKMMGKGQDPDALEMNHD